jgi:hypothetical protein
MRGRGKRNRRSKSRGKVSKSHSIVMLCTVFVIEP